jgi:DNA-binding IscR family transcriptional regulator
LVNNGVLRSIRGDGDGYVLSRPPNQISILHIVQAFDNALDSSIPATKGVQFDARVKLLATLRQASEAASEQLHRLTIADIMDFGDLGQNLFSQHE